MEYRKFGDTYLVRMDPGEEILEQVKKLALAEDIHLATVQALGAVREFTVGVFDTVDVYKRQVLGGLGNIWGSLIAAAALTVLPELLRAFSDYRMLVYAIVLILVMLATNNERCRCV